jgi:hypothetical protein
VLQRANVDTVAVKFESMTHLWTSADERGIAERRRNEATLWREGFVALQLA